MDSAEGAVVGVSDQSGEVFCGVEVLVDDKVSFASPLGGYGVDGEDYLEVALGAAEVGEGVGETGDDGSAAGGV